MLEAASLTAEATLPSFSWKNPRRPSYVRRGEHGRTPGLQTSTHEGTQMPLYMTQFSYTTEAWAALAKNPQDRSVPVKALFEKIGGRLIGMYYCYGEYDGVIISECPDNASQAGATIAAVLPGHVRSIKTTVLFSVAEAMQAMKRAGTISYSGPGN
jgi:uncharacterized protein with GYD domain